jgi:hypothetical protein
MERAGANNNQQEGLGKINPTQPIKQEWNNIFKLFDLFYLKHGYFSVYTLFFETRWRTLSVRRSAMHSTHKDTDNFLYGRRKYGGTTG